MILLNGLPSPLTYSITVDAADNRVRSFHRTTAEDTFLGDVPSAAAAVRRDRAAKLLTDTLELKLEYVREAGRHVGRAPGICRWIRIPFM